MMKKILAFSGSNSSTSVNQQLINLVADKVSTHQVEVVDIRDFPLPMFGQDLEKESGSPENANKFRALMNSADGYIISSPEHNGSMPAVFKNLIDWVSRIKESDDSSVFNKKPVLLFSTSPGPRGGMSNLQNLTNIMPYWGADIVDSYSLGSFYKQISDGKLVAEKDAEVSALVEKLEQKLSS